MCGRASENEGNRDAAADAQVCACAASKGRAGEGLTRTHGDRAPRKDRLVAEPRPGIGPRERHDASLRKSERAADDRHLEGRRVSPVAHEPVSERQRDGIGGSRRGDSGRRVTGTSQVLNRGQVTGSVDEDRAHAGSNRTRSPGAIVAMGSRAASNNTRSVLPMTFQPPGD